MHELTSQLADLVGADRCAKAVLSDIIDREIELRRGKIRQVGSRAFRISGS